MFIKKEKYKLMQMQIRQQKKEIERLEAVTVKWEEENKMLRDDLDNEHLENHIQHKKLLNIERRIEKPFSTMKDALDLKSDIKKVLSKT